eukprot:905987_1
MNDCASLLYSVAVSSVFSSSSAFSKMACTMKLITTDCQNVIKTIHTLDAQKLVEGIACTTLIHLLSHHKISRRKENGHIRHEHHIKLRHRKLLPTYLFSLNESVCNHCDNGCDWCLKNTNCMQKS